MTSPSLSRTTYRTPKHHNYRRSSSTSTAREKNVLGPCPLTLLHSLLFSNQELLLRRPNECTQSSDANQFLETAFQSVCHHDAKITTHETWKASLRRWSTSCATPRVRNSDVLKSKWPLHRSTITLCRNCGCNANRNSSNIFARVHPDLWGSACSKLNIPVIWRTRGS